MDKTPVYLSDEQSYFLPFTVVYNTYHSHIVHMTFEEYDDCIRVMNEYSKWQRRLRELVEESKEND